MLHYRLHRDPKSSHQQIARQVRRLGRGPILDVGAAQGILGQLLQEAGVQLDIDGVEPNPVWAEHARPYYRRVHASTIEEANLPDGTYRVVVCADVLEHLPDPVGALGQLRRASSAYGDRNSSVSGETEDAGRRRILLERFPRMERGILDRTHLHFFTRDTAIDTLREGGLEVVKSSATGIPLDELWPKGEGTRPYKVLTRLQHLALAVAPRLFGFQWVLTARVR